MDDTGRASDAGASADHEADLAAEAADYIQTQLAILSTSLGELRQRERCFRSGADGERRVAEETERVIHELGAADWHLLADRKWPGTRRANLDLLIVGPPGVFVLDVKNWKDVRIAHDTLWRDQLDATDELDKIRAQADSVAETLAAIGLAPTAVEPVLVLANRRGEGVLVRGVTVVGRTALRSELVRRGFRFDAAAVDKLVRYLDEQCPPAAPRKTTSPARQVPAPKEDAAPLQSQEELFDAEDIYAAAREAAARGRVEEWMTWLHPEQTPLVSRSFAGPARIRGAAGTGKTVVALHRARHLAQQPQARVLVTSFVRTLPRVYEGLFLRMAPQATERVEFVGLHSWAMRLLRMRDIPVDVVAAPAIFDEAWRDVGQKSELAKLPVPANYWKEEITSAIKARGIDRLEDYLSLARVGRRTPLREDQRRAVWDLFEAYQDRLRAAYSHDWEDVLLLALRSVQAEPIAQSYTSVIVDEVQDLNRVGLQLLHALVGDRPDGLILIGDGQQSVYPGGFTLSEAGVNVKGRSISLDRNYRNAASILQYALEYVAEDSFSDLDSAEEPGARQVAVERQGGQVANEEFRDRRGQAGRLLELLQWTVRNGTRLGDMAILVPSNRDVERWSEAMAAAGLATCLLTDYDGRSNDAIKIGTYQRAKGLEFCCAFLPDFTSAEVNGEGAAADGVALRRRQQFVAMTRARDRLWIGSVVPTARSRRPERGSARARDQPSSGCRVPCRGEG